MQQVGRGTRKADGKDDCLVLDFAGNVRRFGPVDDPRIATKGGGNGEAPTKTCPDMRRDRRVGRDRVPGLRIRISAQSKKSSTPRKPTPPRS